MADTSKLGLAFIAESAWGTTPGSPTLTALRFNNTNLKQASDTKVSEEIRTDRQIPDIIRMGARAIGDIGAELSYGTFDTLLESLMQGAWTTNVLSNGSTRKSLTIEKSINESTPYYELFKGMEVGSARFNFAVNEIVTLTLSLMGKHAGASASSVTGSAITAAPTGPVMNCNSGITAITEGGGALAQVLSISLNVDNGSRFKHELGNTQPIELGYARHLVSGELRAYFQNVTLYNKYLNNTASSLAWTVSDGTSSYAFSLPAIEYMDGAELETPGSDQDIIVRMPFHAKRDTVTGKTMRITRTP